MELVIKKLPRLSLPEIIQEDGFIRGIQGKFMPTFQMEPIQKMQNMRYGMEKTAKITVVVEKLQNPVTL